LREMVSGLALPAREETAPVDLLGAA